MPDDIITMDADSFLAETTPADITPQSALAEIQQRFDELAPLRARSQEGLALWLGSIHELEPVFQSEEGRKELEKAVQKQASVRKSRTYVAAKRSIINLLLVKHLGLDSDNSQRLGYEQALQAAPKQPRSAETFAKWLKAAGGVSGARKHFRKLKKAGAFPVIEDADAAPQAKESGIEKLAKRPRQFHTGDLLPDALPPEVQIKEGYFMMIGHAARDETGALKPSTVGLWDGPAILEAAAKAVEKAERDSKKTRKKLQAELKTTAACWKRMSKTGYKTGGATLDRFFEDAEQEAKKLEQEEIKEIEAAVQVDAADDQVDDVDGQVDKADDTDDDQVDDVDGQVDKADDTDDQEPEVDENEHTPEA